MSSDRSPVVAVFGGSRPPADSAEYAEARRTGGLLACAGFTVMNGGYGGTMEASARGARENHGRTIGVISGEFAFLKPNAFLDEIVKRDDLFSRISAMQTQADAFVVLRGSIGTLAELTLVWNLSKLDPRHRKPILLVGSGWQAVLDCWRDQLAVSDDELALLQVMSKPEDAVDHLSRVLGGESRPAPRTPSPQAG